eukprot:jgi/Psemu1/60227/gm1.60227_g
MQTKHSKKTSRKVVLLTCHHVNFVKNHWMVSEQPRQTTVMVWRGQPAVAANEAIIVSNSEHIEGIGSAAAVTNKRARDHDEDSPADPPIDPTSSNAQSQSRN